MPERAVTGPLPAVGCLCAALLLAVAGCSSPAQEEAPPPGPAHSPAPQDPAGEDDEAGEEELPEPGVSVALSYGAEEAAAAGLAESGILGEAAGEVEINGETITEVFAAAGAECEGGPDLVEAEAVGEDGVRLSVRWNGDGTGEAAFHQGNNPGDPGWRSTDEPQEGAWEFDGETITLAGVDMSTSTDPAAAGTAAGSVRCTELSSPGS